MSPGYLLCSVPAAGKSIYLTFDDGPCPETTPWILEILDQYNAKATFFMVGNNVSKHRGLYDRIVTEGHSVGNHTFHHLNGWHTPAGAYADDVHRCRELVDSPLFRPPYGRISPTQYFLLRKEFSIVFWSVLTWDFHRGTSPEQCLENATGHSGNGSIVLFHDSPKAIEKVRYALPGFLQHFAALGYRFNHRFPSSAKL